MIKHISNSWNFNQPIIKIASSKWTVTYKSSPGYTYVSALFLGAGEYYGCNNNGDYFKEEDLIDHHKSFLNGHHYKHHKNSDPKKAYGTVEEVHFNPEMHRVEGVIKIDNDKSPDMVARIERGEHIPLSMACRVKHDICSICGKKSTQVSDYCEHLKDHMGEILDDGRRVYAINPDPDFFDISEVIRGADPTAFTFRKLASNEKPNVQKSIPKPRQQPLDSVKNWLPFGLLPHPAVRAPKVAILTNLAEIEKEIPAMTDKLLMKGISKKKLCCPPGVAAKTASLYRPMDFGIRGKCAMYSYLLNHPDRDAYLGAVDIVPIPGYEPDRTLEKTAVEYRILHGEENGFRLSNKVVETDMLAKIAAMNVDILSKHPGIDPLAIRLSILQNMVE